MLHWFGPTAWDAPICETCPQCYTPVDCHCGRCDVPIKLSDRGVTMPLLEADGKQSVIAFHLDCHIKSIMPHRKWPTLGLVPTEADGLDKNGFFECKDCGVRWSAFTGWVLYTKGTRGKSLG